MLWWQIAFSFLGGSLLGAFFFGGLWWTVQRLPRARAPALLALFSLVFRAAAVLGIFYLILTGFSGIGWPRLAAVLAGFILARQIIVSRLRPRRRGPAVNSILLPAKEAEKNESTR